MVLSNRSPTSTPRLCDYLRVIKKEKIEIASKRRNKETRTLRTPVADANATAWGMKCWSSLAQSVWRSAFFPRSEALTELSVSTTWGIVIRALGSWCQHLSQIAWRISLTFGHCVGRKSDDAGNRGSFDVIIAMYIWSSGMFSYGRFKVSNSLRESDLT